MIQIKDDTFTTNKKRVLELCRGIRERGLQFLWSCDTRVDVLGDELLREMRLAGCERLSLGVESGSQAILDAIDKKITVDEILESTELAKKYGIKVRYYMMVGNRGETRADLRRDAALSRAREAAPVHLRVPVGVPGHARLRLRVRGGLARRGSFTSSAISRSSRRTFDASDEDTDYFPRLVPAQQGPPRAVSRGRRRVPRHPRAPRRTTLRRTWTSRGRSFTRASSTKRSGTLAARWSSGTRCPVSRSTTSACIAAERGDFAAMKTHFREAMARDPQHWALAYNVRAVERGDFSSLVAKHEFQLLERPAQPTLPGALPDDFAVWSPPPPPPDKPIGSVRSDGVRKLRVVAA